MVPWTVSRMESLHLGTYRPVGLFYQGTADVPQSLLCGAVTFFVMGKTISIGHRISTRDKHLAMVLHSEQGYQK